MPDDVLAALTLFHNFLQGDIPEGVHVRKFRKMNPDQAFAVIWFLQEYCHLVSDQYEMCHGCVSIYDSSSGGIYDEKSGYHYCDSCSCGRGSEARDA